MKNDAEETKFDSKKAETLAMWYLRFNGYFTVDSFTIHASDPSNRIFRGKVKNLTEIDILGIRHKFNKELPIKETKLQNDVKLLHKENPTVDFIIAEVKTGNERGLNKFWNRKNDKAKITELVKDVEYIIKFAGFIEDNNTINEAAESIAREGSYLKSDNSFGIRLILISEKSKDANWRKITNILLDEVINFIVEERNCYKKEGVLSASMHTEWNPLINSIFKISNSSLDENTKKQQIRDLLQEERKVAVSRFGIFVKKIKICIINKLRQFKNLK